MAQLRRRVSTTASAKRNLDAGEVDAQPLLEVVDLVLLLEADERHRDALLARAGGAAGAVRVVRLVVGQGEVEDVRQVVDVDAAGGHVGGNEDLEVALLEAHHDPIARGLAEVAVDGVGPVAALDRCSASFCVSILVRQKTTP